MKLPFLSLKIIDCNLESVFLILQGVSRYISSIVVNESLVKNEGLEVLTLLQSRYPAKKIILDISQKQEIDTFVRTVVEKTGIKFFIVANSVPSLAKEKLCQFIVAKDKKVVLSGKAVDLTFLNKFGIDHVFHLHSPSTQDEIWTKTDFEQIQLLRKNNVFVTAGDVGAADIPKFEGVWVDEFLVSKEVCYSFNPVQTCKLIYSEIKKTYLLN